MRDMEDGEYADELDIFEHPDQYSYYQTVAFLRRMHRRATHDRESEEDFLRRRLRVNSYLSLAFPPNDVAGLRILPPPESETRLSDDEARPPTFAPGERLEVTATFMGLYGSASPLPTFYTEELLDDYRNDLSGAKSFLDLVGQLFFIRYFQALGKYRLLDRVMREDDGKTRKQLFCLFGMGHPESAGEYAPSDRDLACTGLFSLCRRSASGLGSYIAFKYGLDISQVEIEQCLDAATPVPEEQRALLGVNSVSLGEDAVLGRAVYDRMGMFRINLLDLEADVYHRFLPGRPDWEDLTRSVRMYAGVALDYEVRLHLRKSEAEASRFGETAWSELGGDAFLGEPAEWNARGLAGCGFGKDTEQ